MSKELEYRCRLVVELHDGNDEPCRDAEPFRTFEILNSYIAATIDDVVHETTTDRGLLVEEQVEVTGVRHMDTDNHRIAQTLRNDSDAWGKVIDLLEHCVLISAESAVEKSLAIAAEDVYVEADDS